MGMELRQGGAAATEDARIQRYRGAERRFWNHCGLEPKERFIELNSPAARLRVLEVGSGEAILFVHGTAGAGPVWAPIAKELEGFRCFFLDRPGWGLSSAIDYSRSEYKTLVADVLTGTLDALGVEKAHVIGGSIGNLWALRLAQARPSRVERVVLMGGGPGSRSPPSSSCSPHRSARSWHGSRRSRPGCFRSSAGTGMGQAWTPVAWTSSSNGASPWGGRPLRCDTSATWSVPLWSGAGAPSGRDCSWEMKRLPGSSRRRCWSTALRILWGASRDGSVSSPSYPKASCASWTAAATCRGWMIPVELGDSLEVSCATRRVGYHFASPSLDDADRSFHLKPVSHLTPFLPWRRLDLGTRPDRGPKG